MKKVVYSPDTIEKIQKIERQARAEYGDNTARKVKKAIPVDFLLHTTMFFI